MSQAEERTVKKDGYELTYYPGFASRATIRNGEGEVEIFHQTETYRLPNGERKPKRRHKLRLTGGKRNQDVTLDIQDPELRIKRITIELYPSDHTETGTESDGGDFETLVVDNSPITCPPDC